MLPIKEYIKRPRLAFLGLLSRCAKYISNDKLYLQMRYYLEFGKPLNLKNPVTFNEKLQWLKLYNRKPEYTRMVDKYAVKEYVAEKIGEEYLIPSLGVWNTPEEVDFDSLPNQFVLKTTHGGGGGGVIICKDKASFDQAAAIAKMNQAMKADIYTNLREWPYKDVPRKIIAEQFMVDESGLELKDYKFFCFNGNVEFCKVDIDRFIEHRANYYDTVWNMKTFGEEMYPPLFDREIACPPNFNKMLELAQELAQEIPFARIDLYNIKGRTYFGEITFFPAGGMGKFTPMEADEEIGRSLKINNLIGSYN